MKNVLILGCGRSGTSIFGEFFKHLSSYNYYSEPDFSDMMYWDYSFPTAVKVPRESEGHLADVGLSFPLNKMLAIFADPKIFYWQVRHPLDTICSLKVGISKNWGHHPQPPDWEDWLRAPLIKQCAYHWNFINTIGFEQVKDLVKISKFEDMLANPKAFALKVCNDISVDPNGCMTEIEVWVKRVQNKNNQDFVEAETSRPYSTNDHKVKVGRWKENMTEEEYELVKPMIANTAAKFGYFLD
ncbi:MAG: hypothetical protein AAGI07_09190, partial [Bacteroidota bacterium]